MARDEKDGFSATAWTIVEQAVHDRSALDKLLRRYWRPLWVHLIYTKRFSESEADDVVQEFITSRILERDLLARVDRHKGKFRSFLLKSLDRFVIDRHRSHNAAKAAPTHAASFAEGFDQADDQPCPDAAYEAGWAMSVLAEAIRRMEAECLAARADLWLVFQGRGGRVLRGEEAEPYARLAERMGACDEKQAANLWATAQARFRRILGQTLVDFGGVSLEDDLPDLKSVFQSCSGEALEVMRSKLWSNLPTVSGDSIGFGPFDPSLLARIWEIPPDTDVSASQGWEALLGQDLPWLEGPESCSRRTTIGELLAESQLRERDLEAIKTYAKDLRASSSAGSAAEAATALYYACVGFAATELKSRISDQDDAAIRRGLIWAIQQSWIDDTTKQRMQRAILQLGAS